LWCWQATDQALENSRLFGVNPVGRYCLPATAAIKTECQELRGGFVITEITIMSPKFQSRLYGKDLRRQNLADLGKIHPIGTANPYDDANFTSKDGT